MSKKKLKSQSISKKDEFEPDKEKEALLKRLSGSEIGNLEIPDELFGIDPKKRRNQTQDLISDGNTSEKGQIRKAIDDFAHHSKNFAKNFLKAAFSAQKAASGVEGSAHNEELLYELQQRIIEYKNDPGVLPQWQHVFENQNHLREAKVKLGAKRLNQVEIQKLVLKQNKNCACKADVDRLQREVEVLEVKNVAQENEIHELRTEVTGLRGEVAGLREELQSLRNTQLKQAEAASQASSPFVEPSDSESAEETTVKVPLDASQQTSGYPPQRNIPVPEPGLVEIIAQQIINQLESEGRLGPSLINRNPAGQATIPGLPTYENSQFFSPRTGDSQTVLPPGENPVTVLPSRVSHNIEEPRVNSNRRLNSWNSNRELFEPQRPFLPNHRAPEIFEGVDAHELRPENEDNKFRDRWRRFEREYRDLNDLDNNWRHQRLPTREPDLPHFHPSSGFTSTPKRTIWSNDPSEDLPLDGPDFRGPRFPHRPCNRDSDRHRDLNTDSKWTRGPDRGNGVPVIDSFFKGQGLPHHNQKVEWDRQSERRLPGTQSSFAKQGELSSEKFNTYSHDSGTTFLTPQDTQTGTEQERKAASPQPLHKPRDLSVVQEETKSSGFSEVLSDTPETLIKVATEKFETGIGRPGKSHDPSRFHHRPLADISRPQKTLTQSGFELLARDQKVTVTFDKLDFREPTGPVTSLDGDFGRPQTSVNKQQEQTPTFVGTSKSEEGGWNTGFRLKQLKHPVDALKSDPRGRPPGSQGRTGSDVGFRLSGDSSVRHKVQTLDDRPAEVKPPVSPSHGPNTGEQLVARISEHLESSIIPILHPVTSGQKMEDEIVADLESRPSTTSSETLSMNLDEIQGGVPPCVGLRTGTGRSPKHSDSEESDHDDEKPKKQRKRQGENKEDSDVMKAVSSKSEGQPAVCKTKVKDEPLSSDPEDSDDEKKGKKKKKEEKKEKSEEDRKVNDDVTSSKPGSSSYASGVLALLAQAKKANVTVVVPSSVFLQTVRDVGTIIEISTDFYGALSETRTQQNTGDGEEQRDDDNRKRWEGQIESGDEDGIELLLRSGLLPDQELLSLMCRKFGFASEIVNKVCDSIAYSLQSFSEQFTCVWAGYQLETPDHHVFVICTSGVKDFSEFELRYPLNTFDYIFRDINTYSPEGKEIIYSKESLDKMFTSSEREAIRKCIQKNSKQLMDEHSNLGMISASPIRSVGFGTERALKHPETCIVLYVHVKGVIPIREKPFPIELRADGVVMPVDVREGGFVVLYGHSACQSHQSIKMGCQIGSQIHQASGTLGAFVDLSSDPPTIGCITSAHVLLPDKYMAVLRQDRCVEIPDIHNADDTDCIYVYQPGCVDGEEPFGHLFKAIYRDGGIGEAGLDVALVKIINPNRLPQSGDFPDGEHHHAGFTESNKMKFSSGEVCTSVPEGNELRSELLKFGCESGITRGAFYLNGSSIRRQTFSGNQMRFGFELHDQIEVISVGKCFAQQGDSGALVFIPKEGDHHRLKAFGILEGGTSMETYMLTPIWDILSALNLPMKLKTFDDLMFNKDTETALPALTMPSTSDSNPQIRRNDSGIGSSGGSPTESELSKRENIMSVMADVRRLDTELQQQSSELQGLRKELAEQKDTFKNDLEKQKDDLKQHMSSEIQQNLTPVLSLLQSIQAQLQQAPK